MYLEYTRRYRFRIYKTEQLPRTTDVTRITDRRVRFDIATYEIIDEYKLRPEVIPVISIPLIYDDLTKSFKIGRYARVESIGMGYYYATEPEALNFHLSAV